MSLPLLHFDFFSLTHTHNDACRDTDCFFHFFAFAITLFFHSKAKRKKKKKKRKVKASFSSHCSKQISNHTILLLTTTVYCLLLLLFFLDHFNFYLFFLFLDFPHLSILVISQPTTLLPFFHTYVLLNLLQFCGFLWMLLLRFVLFLDFF